MSIFSPNDLVFYKENDTIMSGGYLIDSILLKKGISPMNTLNQYGGIGNYNSTNNSVSNIFENLAVPAGLLYTYSKGNIINQFNDPENKHGGKKTDESILLDDEIHDDFIKQIEVDFYKNKKNNKTKYNKNKLKSKSKSNNQNKTKKIK